ncbi:MAG: electron transfer flavoprotein subunit beta/FixA family protein [Candidatus Bathyarchaeota archaeon]|nr:electron transfer flavoprotein subunit beta/FixA family protein [Candidatus Bathyarchaeota archaeon A05DMB-5]MDH7557364.1 electron transfer flavoprotein subunit beta/FixA family protein [Candidatus Bathyarchaeota archaeon]
MKRIIVCLKQAVDVSQLKVDPATRQLLVAGAPKKMSDFDKNALEEAIRIKEKFGGSVEIFTVTVTAEDVKAILREALAMGADKAYVVNDVSFKNIDTFGTAYVLAGAIKKIGGFDLILCGETSLDSFSGLVGARLAELLGLPQVGYVRKLSVEGEVVVAERMLENAVETVKVKLPAVVSVTREINQPRIPSLMMIMKASKKEIVSWVVADLGLQAEKFTAKIDVVEVLAPKTERKKIKITGESVQEIAEKLAKALIQEGIVGRR